jgi:hypothetical protein
VGNLAVISCGALWPDELANIDQVGIADAVMPLDVPQVLPVIIRDPEQRVAVADHVVIAIIRAVGGSAVGLVITAAAARHRPRRRIIPVGDVQHLTGVDIVIVTHPRVGGDERGKGNPAASGDLGEPVTAIWSRRLISMFPPLVNPKNG